MGTFIEKNCTIEHEGRTFESGGALISPDLLICYLANVERCGCCPTHGDVTTWKGEKIGTYRITSSWSTVSRYGLRTTMHQVKVVLSQGGTYTGRSQGPGMIFKGRRVASQR